MKTKGRVLAALGVAMTLLLAACGGDTADGEKTGDDAKTTTIRMGIQPWIGYAQWYVAADKGIDAANGIKPELTVLENDSDQSAAFASGRIDMDNIATHTALLLISQGIDLKIVAIEDTSTKADAIIARGDVKSIADLKGKKVAYEQGATSDLLLNAALESQGLTLEDIIPVPMGASEAGTALIGGKVDVAVTYEPYISTALAEDSSVAVIYDGSKAPGLISDVLFVSSDFAESNPEAVKAAVKAWGESVDAYNADPAAAQKIIAKGIGEDAEALKTAFDGVQYYNTADTKKAFEGTFQDETLPSVYEAAKKIGLITKDVDLTKVVDTSFLP